jgi:hypothetical protein
VKGKPTLVTNARDDQLLRIALWKESVAKRRCLILVVGYFEPGLGSAGAKGELLFTIRDRPVFFIAGLWSADPDGTRAYSMVTTSPNDYTAPFHDRQPVVLSDADALAWIGSQTLTPERVFALSRPPPSEIMQHEVIPAVPRATKPSEHSKQITGEPPALERVFEESGKDAATIVVRLHPGPVFLQEPGHGCRGEFRDGLAGERRQQPFQVFANPVHLGRRKLILGEFMFLGRDVFRHGLSQRLLLFRLAVVGEGEVEVERQRTRQAREPAKDRFGLVKLILSQPGDGRARAGVTLEPIHFLNLTFCFRFRAGLEILAEALTVDARVELENDFPGGIRELLDDERSDCFHDRFGRSTAKSVIENI